MKLSEADAQDAANRGGNDAGGQSKIGDRPCMGIAVCSWKARDKMKRRSLGIKRGACLIDIISSAKRIFAIPRKVHYDGSE